MKTPKEIAKEYGFSESHIRKLICLGQIEAEKIGRFYVIDPAKVKNLKRKRIETNDEMEKLSNGND